ncbi:hypothetical protein COE61_01080 [Bacillus thuringiensis]|nr:hypothetical protein COM97_21195 [Bacillus thuringiensis]PEV11486.1 hypothetical protein CN417_09320 [Bacillus thuringiensis]PFI29180.1 hypothetical protein COI53_16285 [Bacillus thuringiensis]PFP72306.1 hypothetical protein COK07_25750 [Bacillus thuringiensis]PGL97957.1 hypothetical protein CN943_07765 [Bacillus thuringiensis]
MFCFRFDLIQLQRLEQSVVSRLPTRQKAPLRQEFQRPLVLSEPLPLLKHPATAARMFGGFRF